MTRKDYELISKVIKSLPGFIKRTPITKRDPFGTSVKELAHANFSLALQKENVNFNPDKFRKACGLSTVKPQPMFEEQGHTSAPCGL